MLAEATAARPRLKLLIMFYAVVETITTKLINVIFTEKIDFLIAKVY